MESSISVLLVDDHEFVRALFRQFIERSNVKVIGEASNGYEALTFLEKTKANVVVTDLMMPQLNGTNLIQRIKVLDPEAGIIVLTGYAEHGYFLKAIDAGARGYLLKGSSALDEVGIAIQAVASGKTYITPECATLLVCSAAKSEQAGCEKLTPRLLQVLQLAAEGLSNKEIATILKTSHRTVENQRAELRRRTNIHDAADCLVWARKLGLVKPD